MRAEPIIDRERSVSAGASATLPVVARLVDWICRAATVQEQRRQLRNLSDDMLKDIGASRADAVRESSRWFWDLP